MSTKRYGPSFTEWKKYFFELVVIITGITISFMVQNWNEAQKHREVEIQTLERLLTDLGADTMALNKEIVSLKFTSQSAQNLLTYKNVEEVNDSFNIYLGNQLNYTLFAQSDIGYQYIKQSGRSDLISNQKLLDQIIKQYAINYRELKEYGEIDKAFILGQFMPFFNEKFPYVEQSKFMNYWDEIKPILENNTFRNLVRSNAVIKFQTAQQCQKNVDGISQLMQAIEAELKRLN